MQRDCFRHLLCLQAGAPRLPGFHACVGGGGEKQTPDWYKEKGEKPFNSSALCFCK